MNDKELVAHAALEYVKDNSIIGLGTGSTANIFIEMLAEKIRSRSLEHICGCKFCFKSTESK